MDSIKVAELFKMDKSTNSIDISLKLCHTPEVVKNAYMLLIDLLDRGEVYGALLKIKDVFEVSLKLPLVILLSQIDKSINNVEGSVIDNVNSVHEILLSFMQDSLNYQLSIGNLETISKYIASIPFEELFNPNTNNNILKTIYEVNKNNYLNYTSVRDKNNNKISIATWRNKTIGHGVFNCKLMEVYYDIIEKIELLNSILLYNDELYCSIKFTQDEDIITIISEKDNSKLTLAPFVQPLLNKKIINSQNSSYNIFESFEKKKGTGHVIDYVGGTQSISEDLSQEMVNIDSLLKNSKSIKSLCDNESKTMDPNLLYNTDIDSLRVLDNKKLRHASCFSKWFIDVIKGKKGGVFLCSAERGMGKSSFTRMVDQLDDIDIKSNKELSNFLDREASEFVIRTYHFNSVYNSNVFVFVKKLKDYLCSEIYYGQNECSLKEIAYISRDIEDAYNQLYGLINQNNYNINELQEKFIKFLKVALSIWKSYKKIQKLVLVLDGIDEIRKEKESISINDFILTDLLDNENIFIFVYTRTSDEIGGLPGIKELFSFCSKNSLEIKRCPSDPNNVYIKEYEKDVRDLLAIKNSLLVSSISKKLEWRYSYLTAYTRVKELVSYEQLDDFIKNPFRYYFEYLNILSEKYSYDVKILLTVLALSEEPLSLNEISYLLTSNKNLTFYIYGMLSDISNFLVIERDPQRGNLYSLSHDDWRTAFCNNEEYRSILSVHLNTIIKPIVKTLTLDEGSDFADYDGELYLLSNIKNLSIEIGDENLLAFSERLWKYYSSMINIEDYPYLIRRFIKWYMYLNSINKSNVYYYRLLMLYNNSRNFDKARTVLKEFFIELESDSKKNSDWRNVMYILSYEIMSSLCTLEFNESRVGRGLLYGMVLVLISWYLLLINSVLFKYFPDIQTKLMELSSRLLFKILNKNFSEEKQ